MNWKELRRQITVNFDIEEIRTLCFDLDIDFDGLRGEGKDAKVRELVAFARRADRISDLINELNEARPKIAWEKTPPGYEPRVPDQDAAGPISTRPPTSTQKQDCILLVGASNGEYILELLSELKLDQKHSVRSHSLFGGSGVNYSMRLMNIGLPVVPILSIGNDNLGREIREELYETADSKTQATKPVLGLIDSERFFIPGVRTQRSTILVSGERRTVLTEKTEGTGNFLSHVKSRISDLEPELIDAVKVVIIGHIRSDSKDAIPSQPGESTKYIIDKFTGQSFIYANPGNSQISLGLEFWEEYLTKLTILQLNLDELKALFRTKDEDKSLIEIIDWLNSRRITTIITLDKLGAICTYGDGRDGIIFALPFKLKNIVDTTGAGDAFGAGVVSHLFHKAAAKRRAKPNFTFGDLLEAVREARFWAAYACEHLGGSADCPTEEQLRIFREKLKTQVPPVEVTDKHRSRTTLYLLDRAYSPIS